MPTNDYLIKKFQQKFQLECIMAGYQRPKFEKPFPLTGIKFDIICFKKSIIGTKKNFKLYKYFLNGDNSNELNWDKIEQFLELLRAVKSKEKISITCGYYVIKTVPDQNIKNIVDRICKYNKPPIDIITINI